MFSEFSRLINVFGINFFIVTSYDSSILARRINVDHRNATVHRTVQRSGVDTRLLDTSDCEKDQM